jgi:hypothetical protein
VNWLAFPLIEAWRPVDPGQRQQFPRQLHVPTATSRSSRENPMSSFFNPSFLSTEPVGTAAGADASGRVIVVLLLTVTLVVAVRSLRLIWGPISEFVGLLLRAGAVALLAFTMLIMVVVLAIGLV